MLLCLSGMFSVYNQLPNEKIKQFAKDNFVGMGEGRDSSELLGRHQGKDVSQIYFSQSKLKHLLAS